MQVYSEFLSRQQRTAESQAMAERAKTVHKTLGLRSPAATTSSVAVRVGAGVTQPALIKKLEPAYTDEARLAKLQGVVTLGITVGADGKPADIRVLSGLGLGLDQAAVDAVSGWIFKPGTKDGNPVPVVANVEVNFRLL
jgi:protein TonB